jgi:Ca-activated chloride channel family protein
VIVFSWPWMWLLLPLPWLVRRLLAPATRHNEAALRVPSLDTFSGLDAPARTTSVRRWPVWLAIVGWIALVGAAARPEWLGPPRELSVAGRDLMLAVDISGSMKVEDFLLTGRQVDRLTATKAVAGEFIERRKGDRIGLILFGDRAYLQSPLTFDRATVNTLLLESVIGLAGQYTAIGDAIGLAVKRLREQEERDRIVILLTDGANTAGAVSPLKAAELAAREGVTIYTIGIGADAMNVQDFFGQRVVNPSAQLDETTLTEIAKLTNGRFFRARDTVELAQIYRILDELEPTEQEQQAFQPRLSLYYWPLALALLIASMLLIGYRRGSL